MECGYPKGKRFGAIDGESLTEFLAMELKKYALRSRNHFWQKEKSQILGDYDRPGDNARKFNLVCDDRNSWVELQRCWEFIWM